MSVLDGLALATSPEMLLYIAIGVLISTVIAVIPGLGGMLALGLLFPVVYTVEPMLALGLLVAAASVDGTGNTITSVLFGVPGSASGIAVMFDGHPMTQRGEGARAVGAGLTASLLGALFGAILLGALIPVVRPLVLQIGSAEVFALIILAVVSTSAIQDGKTSKALASAGLGFMLALIGQQPSTAELRFTFGSLYLWDGIQILPAVIGLYGIAEMISLSKSGGTIVKKESQVAIGGNTLEGVKDAFRHWRTTLQSSWIGMIIGVIPGLGAGAAQFIAYGQAAKTSKNRKMFGKGAVEGIIAADAATSSKEGGAMLPTLAFGIPGSASMAILLAALVSVGVVPGRAMLDEHLDVTWMLVFVLIISNIMATAICLVSVKYFVRLTTIDAKRLVGPILITCCFGAYFSSGHIGDVIVALLLGFFGYALKVFGYSRATFMIAFVLGGIVERYYQLTMRLDGWAFVFRPISAGILMFVLLSLVGPPLFRVIRQRRRATPDLGEDLTEADDRS